MKAGEARRHTGIEARNGWHRPLFVVAALGAMLAGCGGTTTDKPKSIMPTTTRPVATDIDAQLATPKYWLDQPATSETSYQDFQKLWDSCESVAYGYLLKIERRDYRHGLMTTKPEISKQWFEFWRKDGPTNRDVEEASLGGIRRTVYFQFTQNLDGSYTVAPKVIVERESIIEAKYRTSDDPNQVTKYWYALRRDAQMEIRLVAAIREKLGQAPVGTGEVPSPNAEPTTQPETRSSRE